MTRIAAPPLRLELWIPNLIALREMKRGAEMVVKKLGQMKKAMEDQGMPTHDIRELLHVWEGHDGQEGVLHQLTEQLSLYTPRVAPAADDGERQMDAFAGELPRYTDPPLTDVEPLSPDALRDILADVGIHIPAAIIAVWPIADRHAAEEYLRGSAFDASLAECPAWLISWQLPEGFSRDAEGHVWDDRDQVPTKLSVEELEQLAGAEVAEFEAQAERETHEDQPWVVIDLVNGPGLRRFHVMHRGTRRRVNVSEDFVADTNAEREDLGADALTDRAAADAYAMYLSKVSPEDAPEPDYEIVDADARAVEVATDLRARLYSVDCLMPLATIQNWSDAERDTASAWVEAELLALEDLDADDAGPPPPHVLAGAVPVTELPEGQRYHPDADFEAEMVSRLAEEKELSTTPPADGEDLLAGEPAEEEVPEDDPAPGHVVRVLKKAGLIVPLVLAERWTPAERSSAADYAAHSDFVGVAMPPCLAAISWEAGPKGTQVATAFSEAEQVPA